MLLVRRAGFDSRFETADTCLYVWSGSFRYALNSRFLNHRDTFTSPMSTGTSTSGPITAAKAAPDPIPKTATATAMASSKLLLAAVKESVAVLG